MSNASKKNENSGTWVLLSFVTFFIVFCSVDIYFVYTAIKTNSGLVTENSYYKGLDYNETLAEAKQQKNSGITGRAEFKNGLLRFELQDTNRKPILGAKVIAHLMIPTHDGADFEISLTEDKHGFYGAPLSLPKKGQWSAQIEAQWQQQSYKTTLTFIAP